MRRRDSAYLNYRGVNDLNECAGQIAAMASQRHVTAVAGVPRSGLLLANLVALHLNVPLTDIEGLIGGRALGTGFRSAAGLPERGPILVVDDSVNSGREMERTRAALSAVGTRYELLFAAAYVTPQQTDSVDMYAEVVGVPRAFEWNLMHQPALMARSCIDIDGVLCRDPTADENDDGDRYRAFLTSAPPLFRPSGPLGWLVTARLGRYRPETEAWLAQQGIVYRELVMLEGVTAEERVRLSLHAKFKADTYRAVGADLFVESDFGQAGEIAARSGRPVYAYGARKMVEPGRTAAIRRNPRGLMAGQVRKARRRVRSTPFGTSLARLAGR